MCKNFDSPHPLTPLPSYEIRGTRYYVSPLPYDGRGAGDEGKDLSRNWDAPIEQSCLFFISLCSLRLEWFE